MIPFLWVLSVLLALIIGYGVAVYVLAKDPDLIRIKDDESIIKKPRDGLLLVACPPDVARRIITNPEGFEGNEARSMYARTAEKK